MYEKTSSYVNSLSNEKLKILLIFCMDELIENESVIFDDDGKPYWIHSGDCLEELFN